MGWLRTFLRYEEKGKSRLLPQGTGLVMDRKEDAVGEAGEKNNGKRAEQALLEDNADSFLSIFQWAQ